MPESPKKHRHRNRSKLDVNMGNLDTINTIDGGNNANNNAKPPTNLRDKFIRSRADSDGSTRDAFYAGNNFSTKKAAPPPLVTEHKSPRHHHHHHHHKKKAAAEAPAPVAVVAPPPASNPMADIASMALEGFDMSDLGVSASATTANARRGKLVHNEKEALLGSPVGAPFLPETTQPKVRRAPLLDNGLDTIHDNSDSMNMDISESERHISSGKITQAKHPHHDDTHDDLRYSMDIPGGRTPLYGSMFMGDSGATGATGGHNRVPSQQDQINLFSSMVQAADMYPPPPPAPALESATGTAARPPMAPRAAAAAAASTNNDTTTNKTGPGFETKSGPSDESLSIDSASKDSASTMEANYISPRYWMHRLIRLLDPTDFLIADAEYDEYGNAYFDENANYTVAAFFRYFLYNPISPEFTSLQQFNWAVIIGVVMGFYTSVWKWYIEFGVDFFWETVPEFLMELGIFTEVDGRFPLYHYMWIFPSIMAALLSYCFVVYPTPDQNEWISSVHSKGVQDHGTFFRLFFASTAGMWSGLSLGPELPLVLTAGMAGSWLAIITKQSMLQARVLNLTAASAAVGGFFGFPMAGALFVLEIPHRMGLQYFEALSPGTIASIVAVLTNRIVTNNDVTGYFSYPFLTATLPSSIFTDAVVYGFYGCLIGTLYTHGVKFLKTWVHDWFHAPHDHHSEHGDSHKEDEDDAGDKTGEKKPLLSKAGSPNRSKAKKAKANERPSLIKCLKAYFCCVIHKEPKRAAVAGAIAGALIGVVGIFLPHTMFWGEAQLQNLIDRGRTPLPIFGSGEPDEGTSAFTYFSMCMIDHNDDAAIKAGFSIGCSALIVVAKTFVIGLSLGTGIIGGHFWGPLYIGCAASHLLTDVCHKMNDHFGFGGGLATYPCVVILCTMGSAHVVAFRAHMAIMLILTLTISAFSPENDPNSVVQLAGDYSAVFPLLVVSVFISLMASRDTVFYPTQRSRGDITAVPEVLCQPGMQGAPAVVRYDNSSDDDSSFGDSLSGSSSATDIEVAQSNRSSSGKNVRNVEETITATDIEKAFAEATQNSRTPNSIPALQDKPSFEPKKDDLFAPTDGGHGRQLSSARLDELLSRPFEKELPLPPKRAHRRVQSMPVAPHPLRQERSGSVDMKDWGDAGNTNPIPPQSGNRERANSKGREVVRVESFGNIDQHQPSLLEQARLRSANAAPDSRHRRVPSLPSAPGAGGNRHRRVPSMPLASTTSGDSGKHKRLPSVGRHSRKSSDASPKVFGASAPSSGLAGVDVGALSLDDIEQSFNEVLNTKPPTAPSTPTLASKKSPWTNNSSEELP